MSEKLNDEDWFKIFVLLGLFIIGIMQMFSCQNGCPHSNQEIYWKINDVERKVDYDVGSKLDSIERRIRWLEK